MKYSSIGVKHNGYKQTLDCYNPLHDGIIIKLHEIKDVTESGIVVPESVIEKAKSMTEDDLAYEVIKVGPECKNIQSGDYVIMGQETGYPLFLEDSNGVRKEYAQIFQNWILGVFREGAKKEDFVATEGKVEVSTKTLSQLNKK